MIQPPAGAIDWPILICLLGPFRVLRAGLLVAVHGEKTISLLCHLALCHDQGVRGDTLVEALWPVSDSALAKASLHSRLYSLHKLLGSGIHGAAPVLYTAGYYRLNAAAGVGVDLSRFDALASAGDRHARAGDTAASVAAYVRALALYRGDLSATPDDVSTIVERERLRVRYLTLLSRLADCAYAEHDYARCLDYARRVIVNAPCREDAHRAIMRCYVRQGERAQALQQYRLCEVILHAEYAAKPETATLGLFDQVRLDPGSI